MEKYGWSSYNGYVNLKKRETLVNYDKILGMIGGKDVKERGRRYGRFVIGGILKDMNITFWEDVKGQAVLGSEDFADWVYGKFILERVSNKRELSGIKDFKTRPAKLEEIAQAVASEFGLTPAELCRRRAPCRDGRLIFLELCRIFLSRKITLREIGKEVGGISASAFSRNKVRLEEKMRKDPLLGQRFEKLENIWRDVVGK